MIFHKEYILPVVALILATSFPAAGQDDRPSDLSGIATFLEKHVIGKVLETTATRELDAGRKSHFQRRMVFANLVKSESTLELDAIAAIKQQNQQLGVDGKVTGQTANLDRIIVIRYSTRRSEATGHLVGTSRTISQTTGPVSGFGGAIQLFMKDGKLTIVNRKAAYFDYQKGEKRPAALTEVTTTVLELVDGRLQGSTGEQVFEVDPETFEHTREVESLSFELKEIPGMF